MQRFLDEVGQDQALQTEVGEAVASAADRFAALAGVAARHGHGVTADDVKAAIEAAATNTAELSTRPRAPRAEVLAWPLEPKVSVTGAGIIAP